ncbi:hypothetical protein [Capnocytophaga cynodegmi]|uniref:Lipoprotein n=1 Tax=Capnocytophaga cynodegmi TaxID=28189 RepID=A0A0B7H4J0_9FLAO|nr:hypothetical protein [Capnocytophaga cynodegmi]CEN34275.1 conserved exported hypothetical protein [Capnocytophaga cynodegmi]CEN37983.1 conserved exported hypothetical protein [Capnocytophaga cynodegmi]
MKKALKILGVFCLTLVVFACSKNDDPSDNNLFVGTYKGSIGYKSATEDKSVKDGAVTVVKAGNNYYFRFSDGIKDLKGVEFKKDGDNTLVNVDFEEGVKYIRITASSLSILYMKDEQTWTADAKR